MRQSKSGACSGGKPAMRATKASRASCWVSPWSAITWPRDLAHSGSSGPPPCPNNGLTSERAGEGAAVEQDVLPGDEAGLGAAQECAGEPKFLGVADAPRRIGFAAFGDHLLHRNAALLGFRLGH